MSTPGAAPTPEEMDRAIRARLEEFQTQQLLEIFGGLRGFRSRLLLLSLDGNFTPTLGMMISAELKAMDKLVVASLPEPTPAAPPTPTAPTTSEVPQ